MLEEISLLELLLGGTAGYVISQFPKCVRYAFSSLKKDRLYGEWNHYFVAYSRGEAKIYCDRFHVRRGWRRSIAFETSPKDYEGCIYKG